MEPTPQPEAPDLNVPETDEQTGDGAHLLPFLMVGVGSSAGGVEAYLDIFKNLPADTGMAFTLVPHLAPREKSYLDEILSRQTAMPVTVIHDGEHPEANHVYIVPPSSMLTIVRGVFRLEPRPTAGLVLPIDHFFRSLASDQKSHAIGVVLSGMDADGALGMKAIKGEGGISIVQDPESARYPSMPRNTIAADHVDLIVPPAEIGEELARIGRHFQNLLNLPYQTLEPAPDDQQMLVRIFTMLRRLSGLNFADYKIATIRRRLARRLILKRIATLADYVPFLQTHPEELRALHEDMLVNVTRFFRDPQVYDTLKDEIFPQIVQGRLPEDPIRIWIAGCATGEEVYSIGICLLEYLSQEGIVEPGIQLFGTDASESCVVQARAGIYPETLAAEVSADRLRRFFIKTDKEYQVSKRLRDICVFARHNVCGDPPFSRLDLISCRNLLIYLHARAQKQVVPTFHYALKPNGYLLLGTSETIREFTDMFTLVDRVSKIYAKVSGPSRIMVDIAARPYQPESTNGAESHPPAPDASSDADLQRTVDRIILSRFGPPGVVVNENWSIILTRGRTAPFFEMSPGVASLSLLRMVRESLAADVRSAVQRAFESEQPIRVDGLKVVDEDRVQRVRLEVLPLPSPTRRSRYCLLLFVDESHPESAGPRTPTVEGEGETHSADQLRDDLSSTKLYLQSLIEERDAKNQELVSANEEIQSANEELQSTNEELETTKEEVQSANEELQTVNEELQQRNVVLTQTGNDLTNLLNSVNLPVLMLSNDLQIRQFTPPAERVMSLRAADIGRPISEIRAQLSVENLEPLLRDVLDTLGTKEMEVQDREGRWYNMRIRPYRTTENKIEGAVLVLIDIEDSRRAQKELRDSRDFARTLIEGLPAPLVVLNLELHVLSANSAFRTLCGVKPSDLDARSFPKLVAMLWGMESIGARLEELRKLEPGSSFHFEHEAPHQEGKVLAIRAQVLQTEMERVILLVIEDITLMRRGERAIIEEKAALERHVQTTQQVLGRTQDELRGLAAKLFNSQEDERRRVARELHDDITQKLAVMEIQLEQLLQASVGNEEVTRRVQPMRDAVAGLCEEVRKISHGLHPAVIDVLGLGVALKNLTEEFGEMRGMLTTFQRTTDGEAIPREVAACLYRIAQEALRNVAKHAGKTHVKVSLEATETGIRLEVRDFGIGFDAVESEFGLGLVSMVERARLVDGTVGIQSALGKGTTVTVDVPLSPVQD